MHVKFDRVRETTTTTGTGAVTLAGAVAAFRRFQSAGCTNGDTFGYLIEDEATGAWETGVGTWNTGDTISRSVFQSSNANALVSLAAGVKIVTMLPTSDQLDYKKMAAADDEFELAAMDTAGTRRGNATAWSAQNLGTSVVTLSDSAYKVAGQIAAGDHLRGHEQVVSGTWKRRVRVSLANTSGTTEWGAHMWVRNSANAKCESIGLVLASGPVRGVRVYTWTNVDTFSATIVSTTVTTNEPDLGLWWYLEIEYDGTNLIYRWSRNGAMWTVLATRLPATFLGAAPTHIGIGQEVSNNAATGPVAVFDWFRAA